MSLVGIIDTCVKKDSELASASLSVSVVSFERQSSSFRVIRAGILASCASISKQKGRRALEKGSSLRICQIVPPFASLCPVVGMMVRPALLQLFSMSLSTMSHWGSERTVISTVFQIGCLQAER